MLTPNAGKIPLSKLSSSWLLDDRDNVSSPFSWIFCFLQHSQQLFIKLPFPTMNEIPLCVRVCVCAGARARVYACVFFSGVGFCLFPPLSKKNYEHLLVQHLRKKSPAISWYTRICSLILKTTSPRQELEARNARGHEDSLSTKKHTHKHTHISNELHNYYNGGPTGHRKF